MKGKDFTINLETFGINYCTDQISFIKLAKEVDITSVNNYVTYFRGEHRSRNAKKILLKDLEREQDSGLRREFEDYNKSTSTVQDFLRFLEESEPVKEVIGPEGLNNLVHSISGLLRGLSEGKWIKFAKWKEICLLNHAIKICKHEVARKTGTPTKPSTTGFKDYAMNRIMLEVNTKEVLNNIKKSIKEHVEDVGILGTDKGELKCKTKVVIQDGSNTDATLSAVNGIKKGTQKKVVETIKEILSRVYSTELFETIAQLNDIEGVEDIKTINELLLFKRYFCVNDSEYSPSNGESSMLMLQNELGVDKDVYILDEPERSLGHEYISDVIVPLIKEKARAGKKVFISTHDANIAVRTLPYSSIFRCYGSQGYDTYVGNPFSNHLVNIRNGSDRLNWKVISMKTLEGGEEAFGERGKIYGNA